MFSDLEKKQILKLNDQLSGDITISLIKSEHPKYGAFKDFCDNLKDMVPGIKVKKNGDSLKMPPQIVVGNRLRYQLVPAGHELQPFLESLAAISSNPPPIDESAKNRLEKDKLPATLTLFIAPQCTFCPAVVRQLVPLPLLDDEIQDFSRADASNRRTVSLDRLRTVGRNHKHNQHARSHVIGSGFSRKFIEGRPGKPPGSHDAGRR
jgi:alkyl hydroperoxide reductase subunit AhpF